MFILFDSMNFINYLHVIYPTHILVILHKKSSCKTIVCNQFPDHRI